MRSISSLKRPSWLLYTAGSYMFFSSSLHCKYNCMLRMLLPSPPSHRCSCSFIKRSNRSRIFFTSGIVSSALLKRENIVDLFLVNASTHVVSAPFSRHGWVQIKFSQGLRLQPLFLYSQVHSHILTSQYNLFCTATGLEQNIKYVYLYLIGTKQHLIYCSSKPLI